MQSMLNFVNFTTLEVDGSKPQEMFTTFSSVLQGCPYRFIQLAGAPPLEAMIDAMNANGCSFQVTMVGAFDTNEVVYDSLRNGQLQFSVSEQKHLQASMPVVMATLYLTTGQRFTESSQSVGGEYLTGPVLITSEVLPNNATLMCTTEGFPVCPNTTAADGATAICPCINRRSVVIGGVTHGTVGDFWDPVFAAMEQAGEDFNITLQLVKFSANISEDAAIPLLIAQIEDFCKQPVSIDGLFVSIPNEQVAGALQACVHLGIPLVAINAGSNYANNMGIPFIGQSEFIAGQQAGQRLIAAGVKQGICLMQAANITSLQSRCDGMEYAFKTAGNVKFLGALVVPQTASAFVQSVEGAINQEGDWAGLGALSCGSAQLPFLLETLDKHPGLIIGTFDTSPEIYTALDDGQVLFGVDQNSYLQGYWPIPLLTWNVTTNQSLLNSILESGPQMYTSSPSTAKVACQDVMFSVCPQGTVFATTATGHDSLLSPGGIAGVALAVAVIILSMAWLFYTRFQEKVE